MGGGPLVHWKGGLRQVISSPGRPKAGRENQRFPGPCKGGILEKSLLLIPGRPKAGPEKRIPEFRKGRKADEFLNIESSPARPSRESGIKNG